MDTTQNSKKVLRYMKLKKEILISNVFSLVSQQQSTLFKYHYDNQIKICTLSLSIKDTM